MTRNELCDALHYSESEVYGSLWRLRWADLVYRSSKIGERYVWKTFF